MQAKPGSLCQQLQAFRAAFLQRLPAAERASIEPTCAALRSRLPAIAMPREGQVAPDFVLPDQHGRAVRLADRLAHGPIVLLFVRGGWCPFCTLTLRAYQAWLPAIHEAGGDLLAITPQPPTTCGLMAERDLLAFETLSDHGNQVARRYGIAHEIDPTLRPMYLRLGHDLPRLNQTGDWRVPLPATFIIGGDGKIVLSHVDAEAHERLEPKDAVAALTALGGVRSLEPDPHSRAVTAREGANTRLNT